MRQWNGLLFDMNLVSVRLPSAESVTALAQSTGCFPPTEVKRGEDGKVALLEENVETLLMAGFREVFDGRLEPLIRQRALYQSPDILGIDRTGRLAVIELKNKPPDPASVLAQTSEYLVQTASRAPREILRAVNEYMQNRPVFCKLYHAGLLYRRAVEHQPGLGPALKNRGLLHEEFQQGPDYFSAMADACTRDLAAQGVDIEAAYSRIASHRFSPPKTYARLLADLFGYDLQRSEEALEASANRSWKIVYFCPRYWFDSETEAAAVMKLTDMVAGMYVRGLEIEFVEYRLVCSTAAGGPPWLLAWRTTDGWLSGHAKARKRKEEAKKLDAFAEKLLRRGVMARKEPGNYYWWWIVVPWIEGVLIDWGPEKPEKVVVRAPDNLRKPLRDALAKLKPGLAVWEKANNSRVEIRAEGGDLERVADAFAWVAEYGRGA